MQRYPETDYWRMLQERPYQRDAPDEVPIERRISRFGAEIGVRSSAVMFTPHTTRAHREPPTKVSPSPLATFASPRLGTCRGHSLLHLNRSSETRRP